MLAAAGEETVASEANKHGISDPGVV